MLTLLKIKEFSQEVVSGKEPSLTLVVPDVICNNCQSIIDLDICRSFEDDLWPCKYCDTPLHKPQIEKRLMDILTKRMVNYQM